MTQKNRHRRAGTQESTQKKNRHRRIDTEQESALKRNVEGNSGNRRNNKLKRKVGRIRVTGKSVALKKKVGKEAEKNKRYTEESSGGIGKAENANWKMQKISFPSLLGFFAGVILLSIKHIQPLASGPGPFAGPICCMAVA